jgi:hypothetical protein
MSREFQLRGSQRKSRFVLLAAVAMLWGLAEHAHAAERVTLSNGFVERCDHHALVDGHMRLYLSTGEDNYLSLRRMRLRLSRRFLIRR